MHSASLPLRPLGAPTKVYNVFRDTHRPDDFRKEQTHGSFGQNDL
jgi:hypothetical protein